MYCLCSHYIDRSRQLNNVIGRLFFVMDGRNHYCSGTLVEAANDRIIISTAGHCVYSRQGGSFATQVMFVPGHHVVKDDELAYGCTKGAFGCYFPTRGVVSNEFVEASPVASWEYDYGFFAGADFDPGPDAMLSASLEAKPIIPMDISFKALALGEDAYLFGYPMEEGPNLMYTRGRVDPSPFEDNCFFVACSALSKGSSGGPWTLSDPQTDHIVVIGVNSWGLSPGMGSPPFHTGGAECAYKLAQTMSLDSNDGTGVVAPCAIYQA